MKCLPILAITLALIPGAVQAQCTKRLASFDMVRNSDDEIVISVKLNGVAATMALDFNSNFTFIKEHIVGKLGLPTHRPALTVEEGGKDPARYADIAALDIGESTRHVTALVRPETAGAEDIDGWLGMDVLSDLDSEIDFAKKKIGFFEPGHCQDGDTAYWTTNFTAIALNEHVLKNFDFPVELDGQKIWIALGSGRYRGSMRLSVAKSKLGLTPQSPGMEEQPSQPGGLTIYHYKFKTLKIGGIEREAPQLSIFDDVTQPVCQRARNCYGREQEGTIPLSQFDGLHIFIAHHRRMLYVSAGEAK